MPGRNQKTEVRKRLESYTALLQVIADNEQDEAFAELTVKVRQLTAVSDQFYTPDETGAYPKLTEENLDSMLQLYNETQMAAEACLRDIGTSKLDRSRKLVAGEIRMILNKDMAMLASLDRTEMTTLPETVERARVLTLDLGNQQLSSASGQMSSRIPIEYTDANGKQVSGFFTARTDFEPVKDLNAALDKTLAEYPAFADVIAKLRRVQPSEDFYSGIHEKEQMRSIGGLQDNARMVHNAFVAGGMKSKEALAVLNRPGFEDFYYAFARNTADARRNFFCLGTGIDWLGLPAGANIDGRNSAMSTVANLLGMPDIIAHAEPMEIIVNGQKTKGTFMVNAEGSELYHLRPDDPMRTYDGKAFDTPDALRQISNMQVLDYICGNVDRHEGNFFMQFDTSDPAHPKLTKLTGIDNDLSFGTTDFGTKYKAGNRYVNLEKLLCIDKKTADHVMNMDESMLRTALRAYNFSDKELSACWTRVSRLQDMIVRDMQWFKENPDVEVRQGHIRVLDEQGWQKMTMEKLTKVASGEKYANGNPIIDTPDTQFSLFNRIDKVMEEKKISREVQPALPDNTEKKAPARGVIVPKAYESDEVVAGRACTRLTAIKHSYAIALMKDVNDASLSFRGSDEFDAMKDILKDISTAGLHLVMTEEDRRAVTEKYDKLALSASAYLEKKEREKDPEHPYGENTLKRIAAARKVLEAAVSFNPDENHFVFDSKSRTHVLKPGTPAWGEAKLLSGIAKLQKQYPGMNLRKDRLLEAFRGEAAANMEAAFAYRAEEAEWSKTQDMAGLHNNTIRVYRDLFAHQENPGAFAAEFRQPGLKGMRFRQQAARDYVDRLLAIDDSVFNDMDTTEGCIRIMREHGAELDGLFGYVDTFKMLDELNVKLDEKTRNQLNESVSRYCHLAERVNLTVRLAEDPMNVVITSDVLAGKDRSRILSDVTAMTQPDGVMIRPGSDYLGSKDRVAEGARHINVSNALRTAGYIGPEHADYIYRNVEGGALDEHEVATSLDNGRPVLIVRPGESKGTLLCGLESDGTLRTIPNADVFDGVKVASESLVDAILAPPARSKDPALYTELRGHLRDLRGSFTPENVAAVVDSANRLVEELGEQRLKPDMAAQLERTEKLLRALDGSAYLRALAERTEPGNAQKRAAEFAKSHQDKKDSIELAGLRMDAAETIAAFEDSVTALPKGGMRDLGMAAVKAKKYLNDLSATAGFSKNICQKVKGALSVVMAYEATKTDPTHRHTPEEFAKNEKLDAAVSKLNVRSLRTMLKQGNEAAILNGNAPEAAQKAVLTEAVKQAQAAGKN